MAQGSTQRGVGLALAAAGAIAFSGKAIIVKLAYRHGVDPVTLIMLRMLFALPFFMAMAWWAGRGKAPLAARDWWGVIGLGFCGYYLSNFLGFAGLQYVTASLERLILYLNPTLVAILGWLLYRRSITRAHAFAMAVSYVGVLLVFGQELGAVGTSGASGASGMRTALGAALVFASAVTYAVYMVYSGQLVQRLGSLRLAGLATGVACLFCIAQFALLRPLDTVLLLAPQVIWLSMLNAVICTVVPVLLVMMAIERIGAAGTAQAGMIGPLATVLLGVMILGEPFTVWVAAGTLLVLAGIYLFSRARAPAP